VRPGAAAALLRGSAVSDVVFFGKFDAMSRATTERSAA
jgi:hypothetical protein